MTCNVFGGTFNLAQSISPQFSLVLIAPTHGELARLSRPGWLLSYRGSLRSHIHPSTNQACHRATTCDELGVIRSKLD